MMSESLNLLTILRAQNASPPGCSHFQSLKQSEVYPHREKMFAKEIDDAIEVKYTTLEKYVKHPQILQP